MTVIFCWLPSHMGTSGNVRPDSAAKAALQKDVSACLILYTDAYQYGKSNGTQLLTIDHITYIKKIS